MFNKVIVSLQSQFWGNSSKLLNFLSNKTYYNKYEEAYVVSQAPKPNLLMFFVAGNRSLDANKLTNDLLIKDLELNLHNFVSNPIVKNYTLTRWEEDENTLGSYSYFAVGTTRQHFRDLRTPVNDKLWLVGEHAHPRLASNVHGAYDSGRLGAE